MQDVAPLADREKANILKVAHLLDRSKKQMADALPKHMTPNRMARIALTEVRKNPELAMCCPLSFCGAIIQCSQPGLSVALITEQRSNLLEFSGPPSRGQ